MKTILQLLTGAKVEAPQAQPDAEWRVETMDLTRKDVDYRAVLEKIFAADSVQVW